MTLKSRIAALELASGDHRREIIFYRVGYDENDPEKMANIARVRQAGGIVFEILTTKDENLENQA